MEKNDAGERGLILRAKSLKLDGVGSNIQIKRTAFNRNKASLSIINRRKGKVYKNRFWSLVAFMLENELTKEMQYDCQAALRVHLKFKVMNLKLSIVVCFFFLVIICFSSADKN